MEAHRDRLRRAGQYLRESWGGRSASVTPRAAPDGTEDEGRRDADPEPLENGVPAVDAPPAPR